MRNDVDEDPLPVGVNCINPLHNVKVLTLLLLDQGEEDREQRSGCGPTISEEGFVEILPPLF